MKSQPGPCRSFVLLLTTLLLFGLRAWADWPPISPEEFTITDLPQHKGAPAVVLLREEIADDPNSCRSVYFRIKILTEAGRVFADVKIPYLGRYVKVEGIKARTVHADGTVLPFDGQVLEGRVDEWRLGRNQRIRVRVKSFALPDVQVGSILDIRYSVFFDDRYYWPAPEWAVQTDIFRPELFQKKATFRFNPYEGLVVGEGVTWSAYLPADGPQPQLHRVLLPSVNAVHRSDEYADLTVTNIPPLVDEPFMPPASMISQQVRFYYFTDDRPDVFWKEEGEAWSKDVEKFLGRDNGVRAALATTVLPTDSPEQRVRKLYAFVGGLENQTYRPKREEQEERSLGLKKSEGAGDVLRQRSGDHNELNRLFVAMVRAAGIPARMIWVASREEAFFQPKLLTTRQLTGEIAIVQIADKELFLDPGTKYCPYGILDWRYSGSKGLRQTASKEADIAETPFSDYNQAQILRSARLRLTEEGRAEGTVKIGFYGLEAMERRREGNLTDVEGRKKLLEDEVRRWLPESSEVTLTGTPNWDETEPHLATEFRVSSPLATITGKRWIIPLHIFQTSSKPVFTASERANPIYFWYQTRELDEVHIALPATLEVESLPSNDSVRLGFALYSTVQKQEPANSVMARRDLVMAGIAFPVSAYKEIKTFYDKVRTGDDQRLIAKAASAVAK